jgi:hypothetical protein
VRRIVKDVDRNARLDKAMVAVISGFTVKEIRELDICQGGHAKNEDRYLNESPEEM